jgi:DNA-directed RNA polymerase subunit beta'
MNFNPVMNNVSSTNVFDGIKISLMSPEEVLKRSHGEVKKSETINYRTFKPEKDGLFCQKIFGPVNSNECACGKYKRNTKYRGVVCEKCGVEITDSFVRRSRIGHIALAAPVVHIWFLKSMPSRISILLDMQLRDVEMILYNNLYVVIDPGKTAFDRGILLQEDEYNDIAEENIGYNFVAMTGAEAIHRLLSDLNLKEISATLRAELGDTNSEIKKKKIIRRLRLIEDFIQSKNKPEWMIVNVIAVLPPDLRPLVMLEAGRFASSDLNDLYRMLVNRNNRLKKLIALSAPEIIIRNEKRMLQEAVDSFFDNSRRGKSAKSAGKQKRLLKSLSDGLKGKQGRFRQNLLGKRVDYSGRSVIVVGPSLKLHQCGLPKKMAIELFKPYLYRLVELYGIVPTLRAAKRYIENDEKPEIIDLLQEIVKNHPILLNRAPTLHRLGIQAFEIVLIDGKAIQLHPLTCTAFNADFDGDQMAVHVPLSIEAQLECYILMLSSHNLLSPSNGKPIVMPSKDMVLGCYYLTLMENSEDDSEVLTNYCSISEVQHALHNGFVSLHKKINFRIVNPDGTFKMYLTTPGRVTLYELFVGKIPFELVNILLTNKTLSDLVAHIYKNYSRRDAADFVDLIKSIGYKYATLSGISVSKNDMVIPVEKAEFVNKSFEEVEVFERQLQEGLITSEEKKNKVIDCWTRCSDSVFGALMSTISKNVCADGTINKVSNLNSIYIMANSGARGSPAQIKQLAGMRGLMSKPSGEIIERPIISNFREGLGVFEYFNSTHGARKGLSDTALKTANSGYLTRRLVDAAQDCIVSEEDCGTTSGVTISSLVDGNEDIAGFKDAIFGRVVAEDLLHPKTKELVLGRGMIIDESNIKQICDIYDNITIRSPITCKLHNNICVKCYGLDLATGYVAAIGDAVGVVAAQSIGEPGTQLTMRTFHVGGAASGSSESSSIVAAVDGRVKLLNANIVKNAQDQLIIISRICEVVIYDENDKMRARHKVPYGSRIFVNDNADVLKGTIIAEWDSYTLPIISDVAGFVKYHDLEVGVSYDEVIDEVTFVKNRIVTDWKQKARGSDIHPALMICDRNGDPLKLPNGMSAVYYIVPGTILKISDGDEVKIGDIIASVPRELSKAHDITGGLPRVIEIFEARKPRDSAVISEIDGVIEFGKDYKTKRRVIVRDSEDLNVAHEYFVPKGQHLIVNEGDFVKKGDLIVDGALNPHDVLNVMGIDGIAKYLINEVQKVYRLQGAVINNKHIEVILREMLKKVEIVESGDTLYLAGEQIDLDEYKKVLHECEVEGKVPPRVFRVLQGITRASLSTESFISAASFQETVKVLIDASILAKEDMLKGLKENVIVGRLIPAGTGLHMKKKRDMVIKQLESQQDVREDSVKASELDGLMNDKFSDIMFNQNNDSTFNNPTA